MLDAYYTIQSVTAAFVFCLRLFCSCGVIDHPVGKGVQVNHVQKRSVENLDTVSNLGEKYDSILDDNGQIDISDMLAAKRHLENLIDSQNKDKRARIKNMKFFGSLGKRNSLNGEDTRTDMKKRGRMRTNAFLGVLGKRKFLRPFFGSLGKRYHFGSLGKRDSEYLNKRRYKSFFGTLGKRTTSEENLEKRRMKAFFGSLGKRDVENKSQFSNEEQKEAPYVDTDKRVKTSYMFGVLGKRTLDDGENRPREQRSRLKSFTFMGTLGKRSGTVMNEEQPYIDDDLDGMEKRRFFSAGLNDPVLSHKRASRMRSFAYGTLGKRSFGTNSEESVFNHLQDSPASAHLQQGFTNQESEKANRIRRSASTIAMNDLQGYTRPRRLTRRILFRRRLGRRAPDFRFLPTLGKRTYAVLR